MPGDTISPFPGMNPYVESPTHWSDFHHELISTIRQAINEQLPRPYYARVTELVMSVAPVLDERQRREPDVMVGRDTGPTEPRPPSGTAAVLEPTTLTNVATDDAHTEAYLEIIRMPDREVVTVVELFSPTNKYGDGRGQYMEKRRQLLRTSANIVEIDLLRAGRRLPLAGRWPPNDYYCFVSRGDRRPKCEVYHWSVRDPMPTLPIPLRPADPDVCVSLAGPFREAFARGQYGRFIDYAQPPPPPAFAADDAAWLAAQVAAHPS